MDFLLLFAGLAGLYFGTRMSISGALGISDHLKLSRTFTGFFILAVGTDLPETSVSLSASLETLKGGDSSDLISGNAIGSCIAQIGIVLGISAFFSRQKLERKYLKDAVVIVLGLLFLAALAVNGKISRLEGMLLFLAYLLYFLMMLKGELQQESEQKMEAKLLNLYLLILLFVAGLVILIFASSVVVEAGTSLARSWGVEQSFIGIFLIGLGTSLPELAVSVGAAIKKEPGLSAGNIIGSNIFDTLIPFGIGGVVCQMKFDQRLLLFDLPFLLFLSLMALFFLFSKRGVSKRKAIVMIGLYLGYFLVKNIWGF